jgi:hypothetical protein
MAGSWLMASVFIDADEADLVGAPSPCSGQQLGVIHMPLLPTLAELELRRRDGKPRLPGGHRR